MPLEIRQRVQALLEIIRETAISVGKTADQIKLIAASKAQPPEKMKEAFEAGIDCFGENYVQELLHKWQIIETWPAKPSFEFIGHLQTNKVKQIIDKVSAIQTVDSLKLYDRIRKEVRKRERRISLLVEVNIGKEPSKSGVYPEGVMDFVKSLPEDPWVTINGLMTIPPFSNDPESARPYFKKMKALQDSLGLKELSMGMTHDFKIAIEEGATQIRIGEAIFGPRDPRA